MDRVWAGGTAPGSWFSSAAASTVEASDWPDSCGSSPCWVAPAVVTVPAGASCWASAVRLLSVVALVSKNCWFSPTWPATFAPAWWIAVVSPVTTAPSAPGAVTSTTCSPGSSPPSSRGAAAMTKLASPDSRLACRLFCARRLSAVLRRFVSARCRPRVSGPFSAVVPSTMPTARARNTATRETR